MQSANLEETIRSSIPDVKTLVVSDVSGGCGQAFDVIIVSPAFEGLTTLKRHRMVNDLLKDQIAQLHAFSQKTYTPAQYEALSGSSASSSATATPASSTTAAAAAVPASSALAGALSPSSIAPKTPPTKRSAPSHNRTTSNVSIPELTLTTDDETLSGRSAHGAPRPLSPGAHPGGTTSSIAPDFHSHISSPSSPGPSISRLHYSRISSPEFWEGLRAYLESQLISPASPGMDVLASPGGVANGQTHVKGESELVRLFEDFLSSQKPHLSASDVAKVRDGTGMFGM